MRTFTSLRGAAAGGCVALGLLMVVASGALAAGLQVCVPEKGGATLKTPTAGVCKAKYTKSELPSAEQSTILAHMKYEVTGVAGKPTIRISGVNVQVVNGEGKTQTTNGEGNLVIGYDENSGAFRENQLPGVQSGSHNLIVGLEQEFTSYGGILGGGVNSIKGPLASVTGGQDNIASGEEASVSGGILNTANGLISSVSGGDGNTASGEFSSVSGGEFNVALVFNTSVTGGLLNTASDFNSSVSGGELNTANGEAASVSGGRDNTASSRVSSIFGSKELKTISEYEAIP